MALMCVKFFPNILYCEVRGSVYFDYSIPIRHNAYNYAVIQWLIESWLKLSSTVYDFKREPLNFLM